MLPPSSYRNGSIFQLIILLVVNLVGVINSRRSMKTAVVASPTWNHCHHIVINVNQNMVRPPCHRHCQGKDSNKRLPKTSTAILIKMLDNPPTMPCSSVLVSPHWSTFAGDCLQGRKIIYLQPPSKSTQGQSK